MIASEECCRASIFSDPGSRYWDEVHEGYGPSISRVFARSVKTNERAHIDSLILQSMLQYHTCKRFVHRNLQHADRGIGEIFETPMSLMMSNHGVHGPPIGFAEDHISGTANKAKRSGLGPVLFFCGNGAPQLLTWD